MSTRLRREPETSIDRLTDLDLVMLGASKTWPQDIGALAVFDGPPLFDSTGRVQMELIVEWIEARLHLVPRLRQIIHTPRRGLGGPLWIDDAGFDLAEHIKECRIAPPGGDGELVEAVERLQLQPLDPSRPMWDMCFLTGLADRRVGLYIRLHHTIADGMAAMASVAALLDPASAPSPPRWAPSPQPSEDELRADHIRFRLAGLNKWLAWLAHPVTTLRAAYRLWPAIRELLAEEPATKTFLDRMVGPSRSLRLIRCELGPLRDVAHTNEATVNDVLLTVMSGGLRALMEERGEPVDDTTVRVFVPVSLRENLPGPQQGNLIAQMVVPLRLDEADPLRRLRGTAAETKKRKAKTRTSLGMLMHGRIFRRLMLALVMRQRVNATSASIPGPTTPLYLAGAMLLEAFPVLPLIANQPLGVGALSYAGGLYVAVIADGETVPDLETFAEAARREMQVLTAPRTQSTQLITQTPSPRKSTR